MSRRTAAWWLGCLGVLSFATPAPAKVPPPGATTQPVKPALAAAPRQVDGFESTAGWRAVPSEGVEMTLAADAGADGRALRIDFRFVKGGGYAVIHRDLDVTLPENYAFTFRLRGDCRPNNLEFKLIDSTGANVWWCNRRGFEFPRDWQTQTIEQRQISFAWGPQGGGTLRRVMAIEFAVTAGQGGEGSVWLDDLELQPMAPERAVPLPIHATASSDRVGHPPALAVDGDSTSYWASAPRDRVPMITLDLGEDREFGGLAVLWRPEMQAKQATGQPTHGAKLNSSSRARDYEVQISTDGVAWTTVRAVRGASGARDLLYLPESHARWLRLRMSSRAGATGQVAVCEIEVEPVGWSSSLNQFLGAVARQAPRGSYPRGMSGEQVYWTVVGPLEGDAERVLFSEDGAIETGRRRFSVEPFLAVDRTFVAWSDTRIVQGLRDGQLPPQVVWKPSAGVQLDVVPLILPKEEELKEEEEDNPALSFAGEADRVVVRYYVRNLTDHPVSARLWLAIRPFQVNPPTQDLNWTGGVAPIHRIERDGAVVRVDDSLGVVSVPAPTGFGAATYDQGNIVDFLRDGRLPAAQQVNDPEGLASAALEYRFTLQPGMGEEVDLVIPLDERPEPIDPQRRTDAISETTNETIKEADALHRGVEIVPVPISARDRDPFDSIYAQLAAMLISRDGPALQPGPRSYARTWIRDGALMSSALLRLGHADAVKEFIEWFAPYQFDDGKVPCCVDERGSDPVPENDSHGEFIYLVAEYYRYTADRELIQELWPRVRAAANAIDSLRQTHRTAAWRTPEQKRFFGLMPASISHEGYSAKPMHSYWDDLFALRGLKDAVFLANALGLASERTRLARSRDEFQNDLKASIKAAMAAHTIDYVPGCADLGDFDATSTTVALDPAQADDVMPRGALEATFLRYWQTFTDRRDGHEPWDAFTPYELRNVGAFVRLGWRDRAHELLQFFLSYQRPLGWRQWPEVVRKDAREPHFLGDLPHTWVAADYIRSVLDLLAYTRDRDESLVVGAGVTMEWARGPGVVVRGLPTPYGALGFTLRAVADTVIVTLDSGLKVPRGGVVLCPPSDRPFHFATIDGARATIYREREVVVKRLPAVVRYVQTPRPEAPFGRTKSR